MTNYYIDVLNNLLNYGITKDEEVTSEERIKHLESFKKNFCLELYLDFFKSLELYLLNNKIPIEEKAKVIMLLIDVIRSFSEFEGKISNFLPFIQSIYNSYLSFLDINILFEGLCTGKVVCLDTLKGIIIKYLEFLKDSNNEFFIHYVFSKIEHFNKKLEILLDTNCSNGLSYRNNLNDVELLLIFGKTIGDLNLSRKKLA